MLKKIRFKNTTKGNIFFFSTFIYGIFLAPFLLYFIVLFTPMMENDNVLQLMASSLVLTGIPTILYISLGKSVIIPCKPLSLKNIILIIIFSLTILPFSGFISHISTLFGENVSAEIMIELERVKFFPGLIAIAVLPAVFEELFMRGIIQNFYINVKPSYLFVINGFLFGIFHGNFQQFFYAMILGIAFSMLVYYTKSIFSSILAHFVVNGSQFVVIYPMLNANTDLIDVTDEITASYIVSVILFTIVAIYVFKKICSTSYDNENKYCVKSIQSYESPFTASFFIMSIVIVCIILFFSYI
ncbi:MAG: lysostaphin resistance A-like protein [Lachnospirales bacterium]